MFTRLTLKDSMEFLTTASRSLNCSGWPTFMPPFSAMVGYHEPGDDLVVQVFGQKQGVLLLAL